MLNVVEEGSQIKVDDFGLCLHNPLSYHGLTRNPPALVHALGNHPHQPRLALWPEQYHQRNIDCPRFYLSVAFRSDLYYRINVFPILLPPLRARRQDIPPLVMHFVEKFGRRIGKQVERIPQDTMSAFTRYEWPGNIRELQNVIERPVILSDDGVLPNPLASSGTQCATVPRVAGKLKDVERTVILQTLEQVSWVIGGPKGAAAGTTLIDKMEKLGIYRPRNVTDKLEQVNEIP